MPLLAHGWRSASQMLSHFLEVVYTCLANVHIAQMLILYTASTQIKSIC